MSPTLDAGPSACEAGGVLGDSCGAPAQVHWGFPKIRGPASESLYSKDHSILGSVWGTPFLEILTSHMYVQRPLDMPALVGGQSLEPRILYSSFSSRVPLKLCKSAGPTKFHTPAS